MTLNVTEWNRKKKIISKHKVFSILKAHRVNHIIGPKEGFLFVNHLKSNDFIFPEK